MKLLIKRDQKVGGLFGGTITFSLYIRVELSKEEQENVTKYKMGATLLVTTHPDTEPGPDALRRIPLSSVSLYITFDDLIEGNEITSTDITDMIAVENEIKESCKVFKYILDTAAQFGEEEIVEF